MSVHNVMKKTLVFIFAAILLAAPNTASAGSKSVLSQEQFEKKLADYIKEANKLLRDMPEITRGPYETKKEYRKRKNKALQKHRKSTNQRLREHYRKNRQTIMVAFPILDVTYNPDEGRFFAYNYKGQDYSPLPRIPKQIGVTAGPFFSAIPNGIKKLKGGIYGKLSRKKALKHDVVGSRGMLVCTFKLRPEKNKPMLKLRSIDWVIRGTVIWSW